MRVASSTENKKNKQTKKKTSKHSITRINNKIKEKKREALTKGGEKRRITFLREKSSKRIRCSTYVEHTQTQREREAEKHKRTQKHELEESRCLRIGELKKSCHFSFSTFHSHPLRLQLC
jgi:hypothetical protein